jgi:hypothetical protein
VFENRLFRRIFGTMVDKVKGEIYIMKNFIICAPTQALWEQSDQENDDMGRSCNTHEREARCLEGFGSKISRKETARKRGRVSGIILKWTLKKQSGCGIDSFGSG